MKKTPMKKSGFTVVEVVVVMALFAISLGLFLVYSQVSQVRADLNVQTASVASYLRLTQSYAASGKGNQPHGIHLESDAYTIFAGAAYDPNDPENREIVLPDTLTIENITLDDDGEDIIFTPPHGATVSHGTFDITSSGTNQTKTITIYSHGTVNY